MTTTRELIIAALTPPGRKRLRATTRELLEAVQGPDVLGALHDLHRSGRISYTQRSGSTSAYWTLWTAWE